MNQNIMLRERTSEIQAKLTEDKAWWDERKAGIQSDFMKELDTAAPTDSKPKKSGSDDDAVLVDADGPETAQGTGKRKKGPKK